VGENQLGRQEKLASRKMPENGAESPPSSARFVGLLPTRATAKKDYTAFTPEFYDELDFLQSPFF